MIIAIRVFLGVKTNMGYMSYQFTQLVTDAGVLVGILFWFEQGIKNKEMGGVTLAIGGYVFGVIMQKNSLWVITLFWRGSRLFLKTLAGFH